MRSCNELPTSAPLENEPESGGKVALDWSYLHPVESRNSITTECAGLQSVGLSALGPVSDRVWEWRDGENPAMNVSKLMVLALVGWINGQEHVPED